MSDTKVAKRLCLMNHNDGDEDEASSICILNDFCLLQILNRLHVSDLCNVVNVNKQFKRVSMMSFSGRYETFCYPNHLRLFFQHSIQTCRSQMRQVLCNFGHLIKYLKLKDFDSAGVFVGIKIHTIEMDAISKYCAGTLEGLKLNIFIHLNCDSAKPLFSSLKTLTINLSGFFKGDASGLFSDCRELKTLTLCAVPYTELVSEITQNYPNLEELYIGNTFLNIETMCALLQMNLQIKKLDIYDPYVNKTICTVASKMENLETLILRRELNDYDDIDELGKLKSLKVLELHHIAYEFVSAIDAMQNVPLVRLKWFDCPSNLEFTNSILKLKTLQSLALTTISSQFDDFLIKLGDQLPLLEELELGFKHQEKSLFSIGCLNSFIQRSPKLNTLVIHTVHSSMFNQKFYDSLLDVIQKRSSPKKLQVKIYDKLLTSLQMHSNLLHVNFLAGKYCTCSHCKPSDDYKYENFNNLMRKMWKKTPNISLA